MACSEGKSPAVTVGRKTPKKNPESVAEIEYLCRDQKGPLDWTVVVPEFRSEKPLIVPGQLL